MSIELSKPKQHRQGVPRTYKESTKDDEAKSDLNSHLPVLKNEEKRPYYYFFLFKNSVVFNTRKHSSREISSKLCLKYKWLKARVKGNFQDLIMHKTMQKRNKIICNYELVTGDSYPVRCKKNKTYATSHHDQ